MRQNELRGNKQGSCGDRENKTGYTAVGRVSMASKEKFEFALVSLFGSCLCCAIGALGNGFVDIGCSFADGAHFLRGNGPNTLIAVTGRTTTEVQATSRAVGFLELGGPLQDSYSDLRPLSGIAWIRRTCSFL